MNTDENENENERFDAAAPDADATTPRRRPFGFWLKLVDRRLSDEMAELFADEGLGRRDWRALNLLAGSESDEHLAAKLEARPQLLHRLAEHGWLEPTGAEPHRPGLTEAGREARERLQSRVDGLRSRIAGAVSEEDFATTLRTLEAVARELGWDESQPLPRGRRGGRRVGDEHGHEHHGRRRHGGHGHDGHRHGRGHGHWQSDAVDERRHGHGGFTDEPCDHERHHRGRREHGRVERGRIEHGAVEHGAVEHGRPHRGRPERFARPAPHGEVQVHIHVHG